MSADCPASAPRACSLLRPEPLPSLIPFFSFPPLTLNFLPTQPKFCFGRLSYPMLPQALCRQDPFLPKPCACSSPPTWTEGCLPPHPGQVAVRLLTPCRRNLLQDEQVEALGTLHRQPVAHSAARLLRFLGIVFFDASTQPTQGWSSHTDLFAHLPSCQSVYQKVNVNQDFVFRWVCFQAAAALSSNIYAHH